MQTKPVTVGSVWTKDDGVYVVVLAKVDRGATRDDLIVFEVSAVAKDETGVLPRSLFLDVYGSPARWNKGGLNLACRCGADLMDALWTNNRGRDLPTCSKCASRGEENDRYCVRCNVPLAQTGLPGASWTTNAGTTKPMCVDCAHLPDGIKVASEPRVERPPLGIMPERVWLQHRVTELMRASLRAIDHPTHLAGAPPPGMLAELQTHLARLDDLEDEAKLARCEG